MKVCITSAEKIISPVSVRYDGQTKEFINGKHLAEYEFEKNYLIDSISVDNGKLIIELKENDNINTTNWVGEEQVSFF